MDDPLCALDVNTKAKIFNETIIQELKCQAKTIIMVTHSIDFLPKADKILIMNEGKIVRSGHYSEIRDSPEFLELLPEIKKKEKKSSKMLR